MSLNLLISSWISIEIPHRRYAVLEVILLRTFLFNPQKQRSHSVDF